MRALALVGAAMAAMACPAQSIAAMAAPTGLPPPPEPGRAPVSCPARLHPRPAVNDLIAALLLGIIEGITEFLQITSTGHLLIAQHLLRSEERRGGKEGVRTCCTWWWPAL